MIKIDFDHLPFPSDFSIQKHIAIWIPPLQKGGNHKHPRRELFVSFDKHLELHWIDQRGQKQMACMKEENQLYLFDIPPYVPHVVVNTSQVLPAMLIEFAGSEQHNVEPYQVL
ncbi:hypothetical protein PNK_1458 [Candidatus Protochlamydia naegleriophila]|uniref:Sugar 3,4-ketoisomerase QdtA cupin domain-containing protein n=1 Tax=Candidatus Protochlamydia naegleriophila TaxID=389348 RepID=A0A0U5JC83_9BACT|nr:hypothetical protein [Candidatus Protochlamydia naegleriophila]CUI17070.1 hypothetical protein PNK_1458 [Candidatus Protochlamydia naegleriophila]